MKNIFLIVFILIGIGVNGQNYTVVTPDGKQKQFITTQQITRDTSFYLITGQRSSFWNISVPWTANTLDSANVKIQCLTGNKWSDYDIDSCLMTGTSGVCSFEDYMMNFERIRLKVNLYTNDTITLGCYYRFINN